MEGSAVDRHIYSPRSSIQWKLVPLTRKAHQRGNPEPAGKLFFPIPISDSQTAQQQRLEEIVKLFISRRSCVVCLPSF